MVTRQGTRGNLLQHAAGARDACEEDRERRRQSFAEHCQTIRRQLRTMESCIVSPQGKFIKRWDRVTGIALLFTAFVTPWEVGFLPSGFFEPQAASYGLFAVNRVVDSIFICDICIQFLLPHRQPKSASGA